MTTTKTRYRAWAQKTTLSVFAEPWWLDAVAGDAWDVLVYEKSGEIVAALPIYVRRHMGLQTIGMPPLTQHNGLAIAYPAGQKTDTRLKYEKEVLTALGEQVQRYAAYYQHFPHTLTNWLPLYWLGFTQTTRYTYTLKDVKNTDDVFANFSSNIRTDIKKAQKVLTVTEATSIHEFYPLYKMTFSRQNKETQVSASWLEKLDAACAQQSCRKILLASDAQGQIHAGVYLVWDATTVYYLMGGADPQLRNSGATSFLLWAAIQYAAKIDKTFDFEGSMLEPVERFVRAFGAEQTPYFVLQKTNNIFMRMLRALRSI